MRFYTKKHRYYCGIDLHARSMYICILGDEEKPLRWSMFPHAKRSADPRPYCSPMRSLMRSHTETIVRGNSFPAGLLIQARNDAGSFPTTRRRRLSTSETVNGR